MVIISSLTWVDSAACVLERLESLRLAANPQQLPLPGIKLRFRAASGFTNLLLAAMYDHLFISTIEAPRFNVSELIPLAIVPVSQRPDNSKLPSLFVSLNLK